MIEPKDGETIIDALSRRCLFSIKKTNNGNFEIMEHCDCHYREGLTKEQMIMLAEEIRQLAESA